MTSDDRTQLEELVELLHTKEERHDLTQTFLSIRAVAREVLDAFPNGRALVLERPLDFGEWVGGHPEERDWYKVLDEQPGFGIVESILLNDATVVAAPGWIQLEGDWLSFAQTIGDALPDHSLASSLAVLGWPDYLTRDEDQRAHDHAMADDEQLANGRSYLGHREMLVRAVPSFVPLAHDALLADMFVSSDDVSIAGISEDASADDLREVARVAQRTLALESLTIRRAIHSHLANIVRAVYPGVESLMVGHSVNHDDHRACATFVVARAGGGEIHWFGEADDDRNLWGFGAQDGLNELVRESFAKASHNFFDTPATLTVPMQLVTGYGEELVRVTEIPVDSRRIEKLADAAAASFHELPS